MVIVVVIVGYPDVRMLVPIEMEIFSGLLCPAAPVQAETNLH